MAAALPHHAVECVRPAMDRDLWRHVRRDVHGLFTTLGLAYKCSGKLLGADQHHGVRLRE